MGQDGILLDHEYYLYIFDATLMFFTMVLFNVYHPSRIITKESLRGDYAHDLESQVSRDSRYELAHENTRVGHK